MVKNQDEAIVLPVNNASRAEAAAMIKAVRTQKYCKKMRIELRL